jgi:hypothetical protein
MSAELERELRERLQRAELPSAPDGLLDAVEKVARTPVEQRVRPGRRPPMRLLAVAALIATGGLAILIVAGGEKRNAAIVPGPGPIRSSASPSLTVQPPSTPSIPRFGDPDVMHELGAGALRSVAAGAFETCAIRPDGTLACWGVVDRALPTGTFESVSVGESGGCAIASGGGIECWETEHRPPPGTFTSVSVGGISTCAIRTNGTVVCWPSGGVSLGDDGNDLVPQPPPGTYTSISVGWMACGIRTAGTLACWGDEGIPAAPVGSYSAVSVGPGPCAIRTEGELLCWGDASQLGLQPPAGEFSAVSVSLTHACAIRTDRTMACWGTVYSDDPLGGAAPTPGGTWSSVSTGNDHACGIRTDQTVACWAMTPSDAASPGPMASFHDVPLVASEPVRLRWSGAPFIAALTTYDVEYRRDPADEAWTSLIAGTPSTEAVFEPTPGSGYALRVRVHDAAGLVSPWAESETIAPADDTSLRASSEWSTRNDARHYRSSAVSTTRRGATLTGPAAETTTIAILAIDCPTCGRVRVLLGEDVLATLDLRASRRQTRLHCVRSTEDTEVVPSGPLKIEVVSSGREVTIDGYSFDVPCE